MPEHCLDRYLLINGVKIPLPKPDSRPGYWWGHRMRTALHLADFRTVLPRSLSRIARFGGNLKYHISVADHSLLVALMCPPELGPAALLHDAAEVFTNDIPSPVKNFIPALKELDRDLSGQIYGYFAFLGNGAVRPSLTTTKVLNPIIHVCDRAAYEVERMACDPDNSPLPEYVSPRLSKALRLVRHWVHSRDYARTSELRYRVALESMILGIPFERIQESFWCNSSYLPARLADWPIETTAETLRSLVGQRHNPRRSPLWDKIEDNSWYQWLRERMSTGRQQLNTFLVQDVAPTLASCWEWLRGIQLRSPLFRQSQP